MPTAKYVATGTIEGYTSARERELTIRTDANGKIIKLGFVSQADDDQARSDFPLWQESYRTTQEQYKGQRRIVRQICLSCIRHLDETVLKYISNI